MAVWLNVPEEPNIFRDKTQWKITIAGWLPGTGSLFTLIVLLLSQNGYLGPVDFHSFHVG